MVGDDFSILTPVVVVDAYTPTQDFPVSSQSLSSWNVVSPSRLTVTLGMDGVHHVSSRVRAQQFVTSLLVASSS